MNSNQIDGLLLSSLDNLPYFSKTGTCLLLRLADYAAQINGFRSTRHVDEGSWKYVDDKYFELVDILKNQIYESMCYIKEDHIYNDSILELSKDEIDNLLEDTLFEMTTCDSRVIFEEKFLNSN